MEGTGCRVERVGMGDERVELPGGRRSWTKTGRLEGFDIGIDSAEARPTCGTKSLFEALDLYGRSTESSGVWYKSGQLKKTICALVD